MRRLLAIGLACSCVLALSPAPASAQDEAGNAEWFKGAAGSTASSIIAADEAMAVCVEVRNHGPAPVLMSPDGVEADGTVEPGATGFFRHSGTKKVDVSTPGAGTWALFDWRVREYSRCEFPG